MSFTGQTDGDFVTGFNDDAVAPSFQEGAFSQGTLPSLTYDSTNEGLVFAAGTLPTKQADTFSAGSAATPTTAKAITAVGTGEAAAQVFTGTQGTVTVS